MNESKKISPIGTAIPTRGTRKTYKKIIPKPQYKIKCVLQNPNEISQIVSIDNNVNVIKSYLDGDVATMTFGIDGLIMIYNKFGKSKGCTLGKLKDNLSLDGGLTVSGAVLITSIDNTDMTAKQIQSARTWLLKHTI